MTSLADRRCQPLPAGTPALTDEQAKALLAELRGWEVVRKADAPPRLRRELSFPDFAGALAFANRVGALADAEDHHPELHVSWGRLTIDVWTHSVAGLSDNDFIFAAKVDRAGS